MISSCYMSSLFLPVYENKTYNFYTKNGEEECLWFEIWVFFAFVVLLELL